MFANVRNVMLKHNILKSIEVVDKENLFLRVNQKRFTRFTLKRIQYNHIYKIFDDSFMKEFVYITISIKSHLILENELIKKN